MNPGWIEMNAKITENKIELNSKALGRQVICSVLMPDDLDGMLPSNLLLLNDGQETENLHLAETLQKLYNTNKLKPLVVVAIHAGADRIQEYGVTGKPDFKNRGSKADLYTTFIKNELLPAIDKEFHIKNFNEIAFAGFSLGGLSALDIAWNNSDIFDKVGVFSGSFWWRSRDLDKGYIDADRIAHAMIRETTGKPNLQFWLQTGTLDETADRNKNGIIDSIDDTIDLIKELEAKGYKRPDDIRYVEMVGGSHNTETWAKAMPKFLCWAFGR
jgi:iron(III)-enterobactin esterase